MKYYTYSILLSCFIYFFSGCSEGKIQTIEPAMVEVLHGLRLSPFVDSLFLKYYKSEPNHRAYAIFFDKKSEGLSDYVITIAPFSKKINSFYESGAANYFIFNDSITVFIYSGLEDFLTCDTPSYLAAKKLPSEATGEFKNMNYFNKFIDISNGQSYVHHDTATFVVKGNSFPFVNIPLVRPTVFFTPDKSKK